MAGWLVARRYAGDLLTSQARVVPRSLPRVAGCYSTSHVAGHPQTLLYGTHRSARHAPSLVSLPSSSPRTNTPLSMSDRQPVSYFLPESLPPRTPRPTPHHPPRRRRPPLPRRRPGALSPDSPCSPQTPSDRLVVSARPRTRPHTAEVHLTDRIRPASRFVSASPSIPSPYPYRASKRPAR